jgi:hypothetical protein
MGAGFRSPRDRDHGQVARQLASTGRGGEPGRSAAIATSNSIDPGRQRVHILSVAALADAAGIRLSMFADGGNGAGALSRKPIA